jgi:hypothetical protein
VRGRDGSSDILLSFWLLHNISFESALIFAVSTLWLARPRSSDCCESRFVTARLVVSLILEAKAKASLIGPACLK